MMRILNVRCLTSLLLLAATTLPLADVRGASRYNEPYPTAASKKGLQVEMVDDALALGVKHAAINLNVSRLVDVASNGLDRQQPTWRLDGREFHFRAEYLSELDGRVKALSDAGVLVNVILLAYESRDERTNRAMLHPNYASAAPNRLGAFNTRTDEGQQWLAATAEFLAERWSRPDRRHGRVCGYIVGNEVNSHWWWYNMGRATMPQVAEDYLDAVRLVHRAVRRQSSWARVYVSLEHHWNIRYPAGDELQAFPGKAMLDYFAAKTREGDGGDFDWHVAFHAYPENLFEPRFWTDETAIPSPNTPRITFNNLSVLTQYLRRPALRYGETPRRVILSEQGFHTPDGPEGERVQAAAFCYAYKKVETLDGIDAFILHRHVDHPNEGGLNLGLRRRTPDGPNPRPKKLIYDCFRAADTPQWEAAFEFALPIVGLENWDQRAVVRSDSLERRER